MIKASVEYLSSLEKRETFELFSTKRPDTSNFTKFRKVRKKTNSKAFPSCCSLSRENLYTQFCLCVANGDGAILFHLFILFLF